MSTAFIERTMSLPSINPTETNSWKALQEHFEEIKSEKMQGVFSEDPNRAKRMSIAWQDFYFDYSKNRVTDETISLLLKLADEVKLKAAIEQQFSGEKINVTENRAVLHTALRDFGTMKPEVKETLQKMEAFSEAIISGEHKGFSGKAITDVVNIGIGGSHLGPEMITEALRFYHNHLNVHFIANIDGDRVADILENLNPETTLFIVVSKSFTTLETLINASLACDWFLKAGSKDDVQKHFVAVSANKKETLSFGISEENIFPMNDWVGGRFSLWGAVGLSICCAIGYKRFEDLLKGAYEADIHFRTTSFDKNIPVILGLLSVWYNNFFNTETEAIIAYSQYLDKLVPYLQQAVMESNGKGVDRNNKAVNYQTGDVVWGNVGSNAQHAFFQLFHQGTKMVPLDFIGFSLPLHKNENNHNILMANFFAQTESLWEGTHGNSIEDLHRVFEGGRPSNTILIKKLTPKNLGSLIALYEHKIFVQGVIWNIYSYDQWGVELGKKVAKGTLSAIESKNPEQLENASSQLLLQQFLKHVSQKE